MNLPLNPIVLTAVGQSYDDPARILAIVWEGATTAGDVAELRHRADADNPEALIWPGRTNEAHTYQGVNLGPHGVHTPRGFVLRVLSAGRVLVYLREE